MRDLEHLVELAREVQKLSYSPYSKFKVGCALEDDRGNVYTGTNLENANWSETICAERAAIAKMISEGGRAVKRIVVVTPSPRPIFPCGSCRQVIQEFGPDCEVVAVSADGQERKVIAMSDLFPGGFRPEDLSPHLEDSP